MTLLEVKVGDTMIYLLLSKDGHLHGIFKDKESAMKNVIAIDIRTKT
jgi:hypothetical protein